MTSDRKDTRPGSEQARAAKNRFPPGRSGKPAGRPKGSKNRKTIVKEIAFEKHKVMTDSGHQTVSTIELSFLELRNQVASGNAQALRVYDAILKRYDVQIRNEGAGVLLVSAQISAEEWIKEQEKKNKTRKPPAGYCESGS